MKAPLTLRRPANWQDFETLCKKLWGEIWNCPEIKKNGRNGQNQQGVDIYGKPPAAIGYFGIQCKGKEEYNHKQFSPAELNGEIAKAKSFMPALEKLYFATTALKDAKIEAVVRQLNLNNITAGLFEIHLFSWEDIVDLIDENKKTHDWYVKGQNFKSENSASVTFGNGESYMTAIPVFNRRLIKYTKKGPDQPSPLPRQRILFGGRVFDMLPESLDGHQEPHTTVNKSYIGFKIKILNTGAVPIEKIKLTVQIEGGIEDIAYTNEHEVGFRGIPFAAPHWDIDIIKEKSTVICKPINDTLVSDDTHIFGEVFIKPRHSAEQVLLNWKLISVNTKGEGTLKILLTPQFDDVVDYITIDDKNMEREVTKTIEDHITRK